MNFREKKRTAFDELYLFIARTIHVKEVGGTVALPRILLREGGEPMAQIGHPTIRLIDTSAHGNRGATK